MNIIYKVGTLLLLLIILLDSCHFGQKIEEEPVWEKLETNIGEKGQVIELSFKKGESHNHPLMAIWVEDLDGNFLQTLYVAESIGKGVFKHGVASEGKWKPGPVRRPAALPVWSHKRGIKAEDGLYIPSAKNPVNDAITGATPKADFTLVSRLKENIPENIKIFFEINQPWDFNEYWTNNKFPDDEEYKTSCQPAVVYSAQINLSNPEGEYSLKPIGHSHYSGKNGNIYPDGLKTLTTALNIANKIAVKVR